MYDVPWFRSNLEWVAADVLAVLHAVACVRSVLAYLVHEGASYNDLSGRILYHYVYVRSHISSFTTPIAAILYYGVKGQHFGIISAM